MTTKEENIKNVLSKLWSLREDDEYYFMTYGREWLNESLSDNKSSSAAYSQKIDFKYKIELDRKTHVITEQFISGKQLKNIAGVPSNYGLWQLVHGPNDDISISDEDKVDLSKVGTPVFFTGALNTTEG